MSQYEDLGKMIDDERFTVVDYKLRRGVHVAIEDVELYEFIKLHFLDLYRLYRRYDAELMEGAEGYFYLISQGSIFGQRQLSKGEMLVALTIAHLYRDPENRVKGTGELNLDQVISRLETLKSKEDIARIMAETKVKADLHPAKVRDAVSEAIRKLAGLNFLQMVDGNSTIFRCKQPIHRLDHFIANIEAASELAMSREDETE